MSDHIEMPDDYVGRSDSWPHLKAGAFAEGGRRLGAHGKRISDVVNDFARVAHDQVEDVVGPSPDDGLAWDMFKSVTGILAVIFPAEDLAARFGVAALGAFADAFNKGVTKDAEAAAADRQTAARAELRRVVSSLAHSVTTNAEEAAEYAQATIDDNLDAFISENPRYRNLPFDESSTELFGWFCDQIGIRDPSLIDLSVLYDALWHTFNVHLASVVSRVRWDSMSTMEQVAFVAELDADERARLFAQLGIEDPF